ncbi:MAG: c-type cytochrome [Bacteroidales bacterium]|nr:c-type cytochrome [Bacteroidales bacterium]
MNKNLLLLALLPVLILIAACKKEVSTPDDNKEPLVYDPTPDSVDIPDWVSGSYLGYLYIPDDNPLTLEGIELGRKLFYDKKLSGDNSKACSSCHLQEYGFSDTARFSEGISGEVGTRQAMAIINLGWSDNFFWDARAVSVEDQAFGPVVNPIELNTTWPEVEAKLQADPNYPSLFYKAFGTKIIDSVLVTRAIAQFERTLVSFNSKFDKYFYQFEPVFDSSEIRGFNLFFGQAECIHCHSGPMLTDNTFRNNGLDNLFTDNGLGDITGTETDNGKFKVTTLRNIANTAPYMHDGRFGTLEEVIAHYNSGVKANSPNLDPELDHFVGGLGLTEQDIDDLAAFLRTFTDESFLTNPDFSEPE